MAIQQNARPGLRKLSDRQVVEIRKAAERVDVNYSQLARDYGVGVEAIKGIITWKTYRDVFPYKWGE